MIVKVFNDNVHPHKEEFKGTKLEIPAKGFIEMEYEEAVQFSGQCTGIAPIGEDGGPDARFFKMIRVEQVKPEDIFKDDGLTNHMTGRKASTAEELRAVLSEFAHLRVVDKDAEAAAPKAGSDEVNDLKKQVAELTAAVKSLITPKKPGRPPGKKEATA